MLVNADCDEQYQVLPNAFLPASLQTACPDNLLLQSLHAAFTDLSCSHRRETPLVIHLVNVGFISLYLTTSSCMLP